MAQNLYRIAALTLGLISAPVYAKEAGITPTVTLLDAQKKPISVKETPVYKGPQFSLEGQVDLVAEKGTETFAAIKYQPQVCIYEAAVLDKEKAAMQKTAKPIFCKDLEERVYNNAKAFDGVEYPAVSFVEKTNANPASQGNNVTLAPGNYILAARGKLDGNWQDQGTYAPFTIEAQKKEEPKQEPKSSKIEEPKAQEPQSAPAATADNPFAFYKNRSWDLKVGRYGANKVFPNLEGVTITVENNKPVIAQDWVNLSHNFEYKVLGTYDFYSMVPQEKNGINNREALFAVHAIVGNEDSDKDIDILQKRSAVTELQFGQSYEVKQTAERNGVGRSFVPSYPKDASTVTFAGQTFSVDAPNTFYLVKVAYEDVDNDGKYTDKDKLLGLDAVVIHIDNKAPNPWAVGVPAYLAGVATGVGVSTALGLGKDENPMSGPPSGDEPDNGNDNGNGNNNDDTSGSGGFGSSGTGVELEGTK